MPTHATRPFPIKDHASYLWLLLGAVLALFAFGQWAVPLAPWLVVVLFLRFTHTQNPLRGFLVLCLVYGALTAFNFEQLVPTSLLPAPARYVAIVAGSISATLPFLANRLVAPRIKGPAATLVFPTVATAWEFLTMLANPLGTFGSVAYSQYGNLPLMQVVSVTGLAGLTFLITWFGATANWVWEQPRSWSAVRGAIATYAFVMGAVLFAGGLRLAFAKTPAQTMQVASFSVTGAGSGPGIRWLVENDRDAFRERSLASHDHYLAETRRQADAGAQLILWPEAAGICASEDEPALIERGRQAARDKAIYLAIPLFTHHPDGEGRPENKVIIIDPAGDVVLEHYKFGGNQFEHSVLGDRQLKTVQTPEATIGAVICWDMDFPSVMRQSGRNGTDILLAPANDWKAVATTHANMSVFRAVENGVSLVRQAKNGLSIVTDPYGRTLATMDHFAATDLLMVAQVPTQGVRTVYALIGDAFAWATVASSVLFVGVAIVGGRRTKPDVDPG